MPGLLQLDENSKPPKQSVFDSCFIVPKCMLLHFYSFIPIHLCPRIVCHKHIFSWSPHHLLKNSELWKEIHSQGRTIYIARVLFKYCFSAIITLSLSRICPIFMDNL